MNIYVGNLASSVSAEDLYQLFIEFGTVLNVSIATDPLSGRCFGHANVHIIPDEAAHEAILELHLTLLKNHAITVRECFFRGRRERRVHQISWTGVERRHHRERRAEIDSELLHAVA